MRLWATLIPLILISSANAVESDEFAKTAIELLDGGDTIKQIPQLRAAYADIQFFRLKSKDPVAGGLTAEDKSRIEDWFATDPKFKENFMLALHPVNDNYPEAARVALGLKSAYPNEYEKFKQLMIAYAVVWDSPDTITRVNRQNIPELTSQPYRACTPVESFGWYVTRPQKVPAGLSELPWQLSKYLAVDWMNKTDREWAAKNYQYSATVGKCYSDMPFDASKLKDEKGRFGDKEYTLANLKLFGGTCRDQAYFARAVCDAAGAPAYFGVAVGSAGMRRGWVGWIVKEKAEYKLNIHGRNPLDRGYYAQIYEPQTGESLLDFVVPIEAKAMSNEQGYAECDVCYRTYLEVKEKMDAKKAHGLLITGLKQNPYHRLAWQAMAEAVAKEEFGGADAEKQWAYLNASYRDIPEFPLSLAKQFSKMMKSPQQKLAFYDAAAKAFTALKRIDIVAKLRLEQIDMCALEVTKEKAAEIAAAAMLECAGEGEDGLSLAQAGDRLYRELRAPKAVLAPLEATLNKTPSMRGTEDNPHWLAIAKLTSAINIEAGNMERGKALEVLINRRTSVNAKPQK